MVSANQSAEIAKYKACYDDVTYGMSDQRFRSCSLTLRELLWRGSYLDVGCGRGEMLRFAKTLGFDRICGTEVVGDLINDKDNVQYALAWDLPFEDNTFDIVSLFDVIEHLLPGDDESTCRELYRVAEKAIILTANNLSSIHKGVELHVNRRPYNEWNSLFRSWFSGCSVTWIKDRQAKKSEMWLVEL